MRIVMHPPIVEPVIGGGSIARRESLTNGLGARTKKPRKASQVCIKRLCGPDRDVWALLSGDSQTVSWADTECQFS